MLGPGCPASSHSGTPKLLADLTSPPCPADERMLCLFATFLAKRIQHSSIKVYLSRVRALHIEQGFPDPLANCLHLQRVVRGIKRCQGSSLSSRLPITDDLMLVIWRSLDLRLPDHLMFWVACSLGYFGFLCTSEFTVPSLASFSPVQWIPRLHPCACA